MAHSLGGVCEGQHAKLGFLQRRPPRMGLACFNTPGHCRLGCRNSRENQGWGFTGDVSLRFLAVWMTPPPPAPVVLECKESLRVCAFFQAPFPRTESGCWAADGKIALFSCLNALEFSVSRRRSARRRRVAPALHGNVRYRSESTASSPSCLTLLGGAGGGFPTLCFHRFAR